VAITRKDTLPASCYPSAIFGYTSEEKVAEHKPEEIHELVAGHFNSSDFDALASLYEEEATLALQPDKVVTGRESIRAAFQDFFALKGKIEIKTRYALRSGAIALLSAEWRLEGTAPEGKTVEMSGRSAEVARRQPDGRWLYVVDHPFGEQ
jgi:ketosteroid isomerase-like protein